MQRAVVHPWTADIHARVVHEVRLVNHRERLAVPELHGEGCLHAVERAHRTLRPQLLGAIEPRPVRSDPPGAGIVRHRELRQLVHDLEIGETRLLRELVAEGHPVVERADGEREFAIWRPRFFDADLQLVVVIADS